MKKLWSVLSKPNRLEELARGDDGNRTHFWNNVRFQINFIHTVATVYVILFCLSVNFSSIFIGLPAVYRDSEDGSALFRAQLLMAIICVIIISNFSLILIHGRKSDIGPGTQKGLPFKAVNKHEIPHDPGPGWVYCHHCEKMLPPRARHCSVCRVCVLKKDHHCFFTGNCIGFYNQKYFIVFCFYGIIGGSWGLYNLGTFLSQSYAPFFSFQVYRYLLPYCAVAIVTGVESVFHASLVLLFYLHITSTCASLYYFLWQMFIISRGQTSYECVKGRKLYSPDFSYNMRSVFGPYWALSFLIPMPVLLNEGDGMRWNLNTKTA